ncbi:DMT family transporter [Pseudomonadota bacterium]
MHPYVLLGLAIAAEVVGTAALKASDGMSKWGPTAFVIVGYGLAFWLLSRVLQSLPVGMVYAIWSGLGVAAIAVIGKFAFGEPITWAGALGMGLIIAGVTVLHLSQGTAA